MRALALETIREFRMIQPGEAVAAGCSGGADSTALLLLLKELSDTLGCVLSVAHLNHCLRGNESEADEQFVRSLAERLRVPCFVERADVGRISRQSKTNLEAQARELRLRFFESLIESGKTDVVALAHTADDQAETVLQRLLRGAGTRGLSGIHPIIESPSGKLKLIRPLIRVRRAALRAWLSDQGESWREDSSNRNLRRARNRIRQEVLPLLEEFNPRIVETLAHTAALAREEEGFWESYLKPIYELWIRWEGSTASLELECLRQAPAAVAYRVLRWAIGKVAREGREERSSQPRPMDFMHIKQLYDWSIKGQSGQRFSLPQKVEARKEFTHLILEKRQQSRKGSGAATPANYSYPVEVPSTVRVAEIGLAFRFEFIALEEGRARYNERGNILLDAKLAESPLFLRNWQPGDAYRPEGHRSSKKLQDLFQRKRIPVRERTGWPVLCAGERIAWARGLAAASGCSPSAESCRAVAIHEIC